MSLTTTVHSYFDVAGARRAAADLFATGTEDETVQMLLGGAVRDVGSEPAGTFAGIAAPDAPVGTWDGRERIRSDAEGIWTAALAGQRRGSFADREHDQRVVFTAGREIVHPIDRSGLKRLLRTATADAAHIKQLIRELHHGHAIVLVPRATGASAAGSDLLTEPDVGQEAAA